MIRILRNDDHRWKSKSSINALVPPWDCAQWCHPLAPFMRLHADLTDISSQAESYLETRDEELHMWHLDAPATSLKSQSEIVFPPYDIFLHMIQFEHKKSIWQSMIQTLIFEQKKPLIFSNHLESHALTVSYPTTNSPLASSDRENASRHTHDQHEANLSIEVWFDESIAIQAVQLTALFYARTLIE